MRSSEFFMVLAAIYLAPDMAPRTRKLIGLAFVAVALFVELLN
jgi:hypothetical protein